MTGEAHTYNRPRSLTPFTSVIDEPWLALVRPANSPRHVASHCCRRLVFLTDREERDSYGERTRGTLGMRGRSCERGMKISEG